MEDLEVGGGRVYLKPNPEYGVEIKDIVLGYTYPNGHSVEGQIVAHGKHIQRHLTPMDKKQDLESQDLGGLFGAGS